MPRRAAGSNADDGFRRSSRTKIASQPFTIEQTASRTKKTNVSKGRARKADAAGQAAKVKNARAKAANSKPKVSPSRFYQVPQLAPLTLWLFQKTTKKRSRQDNAEEPAGQRLAKRAIAPAGMSAPHPGRTIGTRGRPLTPSPSPSLSISEAPPSPLYSDLSCGNEPQAVFPPRAPVPPGPFYPSPSVSAASGPPPPRNPQRINYGEAQAVFPPQTPPPRRPFYPSPSPS
ncbi:hypothetical protein FRB90_002316 [Tulasnella sp. 427]|nr:hypothetical protein FRB90_002316 [Tulasnella sp. 427]